MWNDFLIAAPANADELLALDKITGKVIWKYPRGTNNHLLGIYNNKIIISGQKVTAIDAATGKKVWSKNLKHPPFGRGTLHNGNIYHPNEIGLTILNAKNGKTIHARNWNGEAWSDSGNVVITGGRFVICGYNKITVYDSVITDRDNPKIPVIKNRK